MKSFIKYLAYSLLIVFLIVASVLTFKNHPEVQFAFIIPGIFILAFSKFADEVFGRKQLKFRYIRSR
jgi:hypothetical protein